jgi:hypothetical protein
LGRIDIVSDTRPDPDVPPGVDLTRPSPARIYDYLLDGTANWAADRAFGDRLIQRFPLAKDVTRANRQFLNRVVRYLTKAGIRQFLDIGAGVPTAGNTHQVADQINPDSHVVYVDNESVAVAHAEILLDRQGDPDRHAIVNADLRDPDTLWQRALNTGLLNPDQPIGLLMLAVLHFYHQGPDGTDIGAHCVARYRDLLPPGSYLAISHTTNDGIPADLLPEITDFKATYDRDVSSRTVLRTRDEINALFGNFHLLEPGTTWTTQWRPEEADPNTPTITLPTPNHAMMWAGVAQKPSA